MGASIAFVRGNFSSLYEELQKMKQLFESLSAQGERGGETAPQREPHREIEPRPPKELPRERKSAPRRPLSPGQALKRETVVVDAPLNFSDYRPYPPIVAHWSDPPELPGIYPFPSMGNWLDYFYRMVPKLQAHLTAIHSKVADLNHEFTVKMDRGFLEKMYDTFQSIVAELKNGFEELKHGLEETATREEINGIIENLFGSMNIETETSVGRVKCIACGREMNKVVGALTETEISRALGTPPNSIAFHAGPAAAPIGVAYQSRDGFDGVSVESPRAVRPFRQAQARRKWKPFHPST
jgi:hypothetical protein